MGKEPATSTPGGLSVERILMLAVGIALLPMALYTGWLAHQAFGEGGKFMDAPVLGAERLNGVFYKVQGQVEGSLLNPPDYPEVRDALSFRVVRERRAGADGEWLRDTSETIVTQRVGQVRVGGLPVEIGEMTKISTPLARTIRPVNERVRIAVEARQAAGLELAAYGTYRNGRLVEGFFDRLLVVDIAGETDVFAEMARKGRVKGVFLTTIALAFLAITTAVVRAAFRRKTPMGAVTQP